MPSGAKKRKAAKKKKEQLHPSHSHGADDLKPDDGKHEGGSESQNINIREPPERGLQRSSSSSSNSSSTSDEKSAVVGKNSVAVGNAPSVELARETNSFANDQVTENLLGTEARVKTSSISDPDKATPSEASLSNTSNVTSHTVEPTLSENVKEKLGLVDEKATVSEVLMEVEKRIDEASATLHDGSTLAASDARDSGVRENEDKLELSYNVPTVDASVHPDNVKDTPARDSEHQPLVSLPPQPVQTTSWKSCCGLFEVFSGSNR